MPQRRWESPEYGLHEGEIVASVDGIDVIDCKICGFKHIVPLPSAERQKEFYEEEFYQAEKINYLTEADEDFEWKQAELELRFSMAGGLLGTSGKRLLDIGSGPGDFLAVGVELGWQGVGVEPSTVACNYARNRGLDITQGFFDEALASTLGTFDFIHMSEVLEHIAEPKKLLSLAVSLLKPGGVICVSAPNDFNPLQLMISDKQEKGSWWVVPDHHLNYFDFESLTALLGETGCMVQEKLTNFPMEMFLLMGQDYTSAPEKGRELHGWRKGFDLNLAMNRETMRRFYSSLANAGSVD